MKSLAAQRALRKRIREALRGKQADRLAMRIERPSVDWDGSFHEIDEILRLAQPGDEIWIALFINDNIEDTVEVAV